MSMPNPRLDDHLFSAVSTIPNLRTHCAVVTRDNIKEEEKSGQN
jgi:hypothetical protein